MIRRYAEQKTKLDRALTVAPNDVNLKADRAFVEFDSKADTRPLHQLIDEIRATNPAAVPKIAHRWLLCALAERDVTAAKDALVASGEFPLENENIHFTDRQSTRLNSSHVATSYAVFCLHKKTS